MRCVVVCPECGKAYKVKKEKLGRKVRCIGCKEVFVMREASTEDMGDLVARSVRTALQKDEQGQEGEPTAEEDSEGELPEPQAIQTPLLQEIARAGGAAKPEDLVAAVADHFAQDGYSTPSAALRPRWRALIERARKDLVMLGHLDCSSPEVWALTPVGRRRLGRLSAPAPRKPAEDNGPERGSAGP